MHWRSPDMPTHIVHRGPMHKQSPKRSAPARILWASDFSPALEFVSFPQTVEVLTAMSWLTVADHTAIYHDNLAHLLATTDERNP